MLTLRRRDRPRARSPAIVSGVNARLAHCGTSGRLGLAVETLASDEERGALFSGTVAVESAEVASVAEPNHVPSVRHTKKLYY